MVDQPEYGTNSPYYLDTIEFCVKTKHLDCGRICELYLKQQQSAAQIAKQFGAAKSVILSILHQSGIGLETGKGRLTNPKNYRHHNAPYGYSVREGRLVVNKAELRVCRFVADAIERQGMSVSRVARELANRRFKNRAGKMQWDHKSVKNIFQRWKNKI